MQSPSPTVPVTVLDAARAGERDAFAHLWRTHQAHLLRYLRAKRVASPEDIASQVWIDVAESIVRFEGDGADFRAWLFTIAHRRTVDQVRRAVRRPEVLDDRAGVDRCLPHSEDEHAESGALDRAIALVQQLPPDMAEAVMLRVVFDLEVPRVASVMQCSEGNVRVLVHRGLKKLRACVEEPDTAQMIVSPL